MPGSQLVSSSGITFEASGATTASGALVVDNNTFALITAYRDLGEKIAVRLR